MANYVLSPLLNITPGETTNKEIADQLLALDLISEADYRALNRHWKKTGWDTSTDWSTLQSPTEMTAGWGNAAPEWVQVNTNVANAMFANSGISPGTDPGQHSSFIDQDTGEWAGPTRPNYGNYPAGMFGGRGLLTEQQKADLGNQQMIRPMILPADNSGQPSWQTYLDRYNDPEYGGINAYEGYLQDQQQYQQLGNQYGTGWTPTWLYPTEPYQGNGTQTPSGPPATPQEPFTPPTPGTPTPRPYAPREGLLSTGGAPGGDNPYLPNGGRADGYLIAAQEAGVDPQTALNALGFGGRVIGNPNPGWAAGFTPEAIQEARARAGLL